jgi:hypothetical protein
MEGINNQSHLYGTGADPNMITLGPKQGGQPGWEPYPGKASMEFEVQHGTPILAPTDMVLIGFNNRSASFRLRLDGERAAPFNDLEICFESVSSDWPGMIVCAYHLLSSPLLVRHNLDARCHEAEEYKGTIQAQGHVYFAYDDYPVPEWRSTTSGAHRCEGLIGRSVERGQLIGFAGSVGNHSFATFRFKVPDESVNPLVKRGDKHLHWVQPGSFFYWSCYDGSSDFPKGVLAYPFECGGYQLPVEHRDSDFKYARDD